MPKKINSKVNKMGDIMLGSLIVEETTNYLNRQVRNIHISTEEPDNLEGFNGDLWVKVQEPVEE